MDRIEAMKLLSEIKHYLIAGNPVWRKEVVAEALDIAIEALQNLSKPNNGLQGSELISIQMAIEHWGRSSGNLTNDQIAELQREIESLPSADRPTGEWVKRQIIGYVSFAYCSECGEPIIHGRTSPLWSYCPNCGAKMRGEEE